MINGDKNEAKMKSRSQRYDTNKPMHRHEQKYTKYDMCLSLKLVTRIKQHLSNI